MNNTPLERNDKHYPTYIDDWESLGIAEYATDRLVLNEFDPDLDLDTLYDQTERLRQVFGNLIEKLYNNRILTIKDINNLIGDMPDDTRVRKVE